MAIHARRAATIEDVASRAGVSRAAVSKVIRDAYGVSDEMRAKVEVAITQLGYRPRVSARAMRGATYTLGIAIPTVRNPFFTGRDGELAEGNRGHGCQTSLELAVGSAGCADDDNVRRAHGHETTPTRGMCAEFAEGAATTPGMGEEGNATEAAWQQSEIHPRISGI